jgi:hypothetical protein
MTLEAQLELQTAERNHLSMRGARKQMGGNIEVVWAEFSTLS